MRYYTKQWYRMCQDSDYNLEQFKIIPQKKYSDKEIDKLYENALQKMIAEERAFYEQESTNDEDIFDEDEIVEMFGNAYRVRVESIDLYPIWLKNKVNKRLMGLGFLTKEIYDRLKQQENDNRKAFQKLDRIAQKETGMQWANIPKNIRTIFRNGKNSILEEACLLSIRREEKNISLTFCYGEWEQFDKKTPYICITFEDAVLLEDESEIQCENVGEKVISNSLYIKDEMYRINDNRYEYHLMTTGEQDLAYITVSCSNIVYQEKVKIS